MRSMHPVHEVRLSPADGQGLVGIFVDNSTGRWIDISADGGQGNHIGFILAFENDRVADFLGLDHEDRVTLARMYGASDYREPAEDVDPDPFPGMRLLTDLLKDYTRILKTPAGFLEVAGVLEVYTGFDSLPKLNKYMDELIQAMSEIDNFNKTKEVWITNTANDMLWKGSFEEFLGL